MIQQKSQKLPYTLRFLAMNLNPFRMTIFCLVNEGYREGGSWSGRTCGKGIGTEIDPMSEEKKSTLGF